MTPNFLSRKRPLPTTSSLTVVSPSFPAALYPLSPARSLDKPQIQRPETGEAVVLVGLPKGIGNDQAVSMLQGVLDEAIPRVDVHVFLAMLMYGDILTSSGNDAKSRPGCKELLHVLLKKKVNEITHTHTHKKLM